MHRLAPCRKGIRIALASALVGALLSGCSTAGGPLRLLRSPSAAAVVQDETIGLAEAALLDAPLDPLLRARLGSAYLAAGRFGSAGASFADAMALGDTTPATTLRLALALTGSGREGEATALLFERSDELPAADLGLALAVAGEAQPAIRFMEAAIRDGENGIPLRQNLALAYALAGRWREARLLASLDVPANALGARMERWAALTTAGDTPRRLAMVLRVPAGVADPGMPIELALSTVEHRAVAGTVLVRPSREDLVGTAMRAQPVAPIAWQAPLRVPAEEEVVPAVPAVPGAASRSPEAEPRKEITHSLLTYLRRQNRWAGARW